MRPKALVVDGDPARAGRMARTLAVQGFEPTEAGTFEKAVAAAGGTAFDVVVTAVRLGAYNGLHLIIRMRQARIATFVTTATADPFLDTEARRFGATCLVAPWDDPTELVARIARSGNVEPT